MKLEVNRTSDLNPERVVLRVLKRVCGPLPADIERRLRSLSHPEIETLGEQLLDFRNLDDLKVWLDTNDDDSEGH